MFSVTLLSAKSILPSAATVTFSNRDVLDGTQRELMEQPILEGKYQKKVSGDKAITNLSGENRIVLEGGGAIRGIQLKLSADDLAQALRSVILRITFDGNQTV